jgi:predicted nucleic acid-binding protein
LITVVDTSAWIEYLVNLHMKDRIEQELPRPEDWLVPTIIQFELEKWARREGSEEKADTLLAFTTTCIIADLTSEIASLAVNLATRHRLSTADAIIYATAQAFDAALLTCDAHFKDLPGVRYIPKPVN